MNTSLEKNLEKEDLMNEIAILMADYHKSQKHNDTISKETEELKKELSVLNSANKELKEHLDSINKMKELKPISFANEINPLNNKLIQLKEDCDEEYNSLQQELFKEETELKKLQGQIQPKNSILPPTIDFELNAKLKIQVEDKSIRADLLKDELNKETMECDELEEKLKDLEQTYNTLKENHKTSQTLLEEANTLKETLEGDLALLKIENHSMRSHNKETNEMPNSLFQEVNDGRVALQSNYNKMKETISTLLSQNEEKKKHLQNLEIKCREVCYELDINKKCRENDLYAILRAYQDGAELLSLVKNEMQYLIDHQMPIKQLTPLEFVNLADTLNVKYGKWEEIEEKEDHKNSNLEYKRFKATCDLEMIESTHKVEE